MGSLVFNTKWTVSVIILYQGKTQLSNHMSKFFRSSRLSLTLFREVVEKMKCVCACARVFLVLFFLSFVFFCKAPRTPTFGGRWGAPYIFVIIIIIK